MGRDHGVDGRKDTRGAAYFEPCAVGQQDAGELCLSCQKVHIDQMVPKFVDIDGAPVGFGIGAQQRNDFGYRGEGRLASFLRGCRRFEPWLNACAAPHRPSQARRRKDRGLVAWIAL